MTYKRRSHDSRVLKNESETLQRIDVAVFARHAVSRRLRSQGLQLMRTLDEFGHVQFTWRVVHFLHRPGDHTATIRSRTTGEDEYALWCEGPQADEVVRRVNYAIEPRVPKRKRRRLRERFNATKKQFKKELRRERQARKASQAQTKKRKTIEQRTSLTLRRNKVAPKFKHSRDITWYEAVRSVVQLLEVRATPLITSQERADYRLRRGLERNKLRFTSITKDGFTICFRLVTNWRGDLTMLRIEFTSDNKHPLYRRVRDYFKQLLLPKSRAHEASRLRLRAALEADMLRTAA